MKCNNNDNLLVHLSNLISDRVSVLEVETLTFVSFIFKVYTNAMCQPLFKLLEGRRMIKRYLKFVKPYRYRIIATIIVGIIKFGIPMLIPLLIKYAIDGVINNHSLTNQEKFSHLGVAIGIALFIFLIVRPPIEFIRQYLAQWTSNKILYDIRKQLYNHLQALSARFYANNQVGQVISRVINDVEQTKDFILTGLMNIWLDCITIIIALSIMFFLDVKLTFAAIFIFPFYILTVYFSLEDYVNLHVLTSSSRSTRLLT